MSAMAFLAPEPASADAQMDRLDREQRAEQRKLKNQERASKKQLLDELKLERVHLSGVDAWPDTLTHLFLDGNNMLFVPSALRNLCLRRRKRTSAEDALARFSLDLARALHPVGLRETVLAFDETRLPLPWASAPHAEYFRVTRARPAFATADDQLVAWAEQLAERGLAASCLFVTSDVGLSVRLRELGVLLASPKEFFRFATRVLAPVPEGGDDGAASGERMQSFVASYAGTELADEAVDLDASSADDAAPGQ